MMRRLARAVPVTAAVALALSACGGDDGGNGDGSEPATTGTIHDTLIQDVDTLLPMDSNVGDNIAVLEVLYSGLVRYDSDTMEPYNYIAEAIEANDDNTVWTIKIKDGWTFQNGEDVNAEAFARAWNYAAYGPNAMENNYFFGPDVLDIKGYEEMQGECEEDEEGNVACTKDPTAEELSGLKIVDDLTLEVSLSGPFANFAAVLGYTGFFPIAQECLDDIEACSVAPIGNGPFQVDEWKQGQSLSADKWADYPGDETPESVDRIEWTEYSGESSWADFEAGNVDFSTPPPAEYEAALNNPTYSERYIESPGVALTYLGFPIYNGAPYDDVNFRKAISLAIDRQAIVDNIVPHQYTPATSWVPEGSILGGTSDTCEFCKFDLAEAKRLLDEAGGWPKGEKLEITFGADPTSQEIFKAVGDQLKANLGIDYTLDPAEDFFDKRSARGMKGIFRNNWFADYPTNDNYLGPPGYDSGGSADNSQFGYYNKAFEAKLEEGAAAPTVEEAVEIYKEAELILAEDFPTAPLLVSNNRTFYGENVENVKLDPFSGYVELRQVEYVGS